MKNISHICLAHQVALRELVDTVAHNITNGLTKGFKAEKPIFQYYISERHPLHDVAYVKLANKIIDPSPGPITITENTLDVAITKGFFVVQTPIGNRYTRNGQFLLNDQGTLVDQQGYPVLGTGDVPLQIPPETGTIRIKGDGMVYADDEEIAQLQVVEFDENEKTAIDESGYLATNQLPRQVLEPEVIQGALEESNVQSINELITLMDAHRQYENSQKLLDMFDRLAQQGINKILKSNS